VAQITRLIARWRERGVIEPRASRRHRFLSRYTPEDIVLLAETDGAHEGLSAPAVRRILQREYEVHGLAQYERLASISASHIYNLRRSRTYREHRVHHTKTCASAVNIGERRKPDPRGKPGFVRVDTVHQGDSPKGKGLYHINAVDTVTQWQVVGCCETISEAHLLPVLEAMLHQFPFRIRGFHSDNGSEFLNYKVRKLLKKLLVEEFTKSRANRTTDNALVEGKNGAVVRKHIGHEPIASHHAGQVQRFYTADFNPYLNYHRPCGFATIEVKDNGKRRRHYRPNDYRTPYEKLVSLVGWPDHLKAGITAAYLEQQARKMSDTECALRMQQRKRKLLDACRTRL
jgi:transposase InsO family protein